MAQITSRSTFIDFWQDEIQARNNSLVSFVEFENKHAMDQFKKPGVATPAMVLFKPEFKPTNELSDNIQRRINWGFFILKKATKHENQAEIQQLKDDCLAIVEEILGRLKELNEDKEFFGRFTAADCDYEELSEPIFDNHYGAQCFGSFISFTSIRHDATKWT